MELPYQVNESIPANVSLKNPTTAEKNLNETISLGVNIVPDIRNSQKLFLCINNE